MKDHRRRRDVVSWSKFFWSTILILCTFVLFSISTFRHYFGEKFKPEIVSGWRHPAMEATAVANNSPSKPPSISILETVILPDQVLLFLKHPPSFPLFSKQDLNCLYFSPNSTRRDPKLKLSPDKIDGHDLHNQIVRCPSSPRGFTVSLEVKSFGSTGTDSYIVENPGPTLKWDSLVYEAMLDRDNTTVVFVKGLNLRPDKVYDSSKFECVYGWDFTRTKFLLRSNVISIAQEIVRCQTPLSILNNQFSKVNNSCIKVSIRFKGRGTLHSIARPGTRSFIESKPGPQNGKMYDMCSCTMLRNQGRFLKEWVMYHGNIGVQRWFIYDNNSDDDIESVIEWLGNAGFNVSRHVWPWVKTQEAGFAHCALRARGLCEWVGFIDVDEFLHLPTGLYLQDAIRNQSKVRNNVAELRVSCHNFGPSGLKHAPKRGVTAGYTCRMMIPERHKSIVKPEALNSTLINVVHHFHLRKGYKYVNADKGILVINHYKYQVWEVFKEKFYRRVATYVADWQDEQNAGSKDRAPGLGTRAVEPSDWPNRFCEVTDTGLRDRVLENFRDPLTDLLPWQEEGVLNQEDTREWLQ